MNSFRMPSKTKAQMGSFQTNRKPRHIINNSKRKLNIGLNETNRRQPNDKAAAISAMIYQTGAKSSIKLNLTASKHNLSPVCV